jgi:hypothetical protein
MPRIPFTKRRLSTSFTLRVIKGSIDVASLSSPDQLRALASSAVKIGSVLRFTEGNPRTTSPQYEFDADLPGEIDERTPHLVDRTISIRRAVLYKSDMLEALGFSGVGDLVDQTVPFVLVKVEKAPPESGVADKTTLYLGCYMHDNPKTYELTGDLVVMQDVDIGYSRRVVI